MNRQLNRFLFKFLLLGLPVIVGFGILYRFRIYPVITNSQLFDSKVLDAERQLPSRVKLIVAGSSVALYDLDSKLIADSLESSYYNFASWGMQMSEIAVTVRALVKDYHPSCLVLCSCDRDFMDAPTTSYVGFGEAAAWVRERIPEYFYIRNYNPVRTLWRRRFKSRRPTLDPWGGDSVEEMWQGVAGNKQDEHLEFPTAFTELQYRELDSLCRFLKAEKVTFVFIQAPTQARFAGESGGPTAFARHVDRCRSIVKATGGSYFNYFDPVKFPDSLFADHTHLTRAGGVVLTREMTGDLKGIVQ